MTRREHDPAENTKDADDWRPEREVVLLVGLIRCFDPHVSIRATAALWDLAREVGLAATAHSLGASATQTPSTGERTDPHHEL